MALNITSLATPKKLGDTSITLTAGGSAAARMLALVDAEWMLMTSNLLTPTIGVVPGYNGSIAGPHARLAPVLYGLAGDFVSVGLVPAGIVASQSFQASGPITGPFGTGVPVANTVVNLVGTTVQAMTLGSASGGQQNTLTICSLSGVAHTVAFNTDGTAGPVAKTATFPAAGAGVLTLRATVNGNWTPVSTASAGVAIT